MNEHDGQPRPSRRTVLAGAGAAGAGLAALSAGLVPGFTGGALAAAAEPDARELSLTAGKPAIAVAARADAAVRKAMGIRLFRPTSTRSGRAPASCSPTAIQADLIRTGSPS
jgi:hypothetical protein